MENVEEHGVIHARVRPSAAFGYEIPLHRNYIGASCKLSFPCRRGHHVRFNIQREDAALNELCGWKGKGPVSTTELNDIPASTSTVELLERPSRVEKRVPLGLSGHTALAHFHE